MKTFHITDCGAKICDRLQTSAIRNAIDDCFLAGGGRVVIPCGIFLTGGIRTYDNVLIEECDLNTGDEAVAVAVAIEETSK